MVITVPTILWFKREQSTSAAWFDGSYGYRKKIPITNTSGTAQTDFQVELSLDTSTLIAASKLQSDCEDLRFTDISGKVLSFWVEPNTCNTATTKVFAKVPSIPTSGADIFWYYGNPSATGASQADTAFVREMEAAAVAWPLDETTVTQSYARAVNPSVAVGRDIVINGGFDADASWTKGTGWTIASGYTTATAAAAGANLSQTPPTVIGKAYSVTYTISGYSAGSVRVTLGGAALGTIRSANGTYVETIIASSATSVFFTPVTTFTGNIDNVILTQLDIPSSQTTATNLLTDGTMEAVGTTAWIADNGATLSKQTGTPFAGAQVLQVTGSATTSQAKQTIATVAGSIYRISGYARSDGTNLPRVVSNSGAVLFTGTNSTSWQPFDFIFVATLTNDFVALRKSVVSGYVESQC